MPRLSVLALLVVAAPTFAQYAFPPPNSLGPIDTYGRNVRRAMALMATSTPGGTTRPRPPRRTTGG